MPSLEVVLADDLAQHGAARTEMVLERIGVELPDLLADPRGRELAAAGAAALLSEFAAVLRHGLRGDFHAPAEAVAYGRFLAAVDVPLAELLRSYRLGQETSFARAVELLPDADEPDPGAAVARVGMLSFAYADAVMAEVTDGFTRERERGIRRDVARREQLLRALLAGDRVDLADAERVLGRRLDGPHTALVVTGGADAEPERLLEAVRGALAAAGVERPLVVGEPAGDAAAWFTSPTGEGWRARLAAELARRGARGALGTTLQGAEGFARSRRQAGLAQAVAAPGALTAYADVALDALLLSDRAAAARFAREELGPLAAPRAHRERVTLAAYYAHGHDRSRTARALDVHRNTVARRLAAAEAALGGDLATRALERAAALRVLAALG